MSTPEKRTPAIVVAAPADTDRVIDVLLRAFAADPPNRWMYPGDGDYRRHFPSFVRGLGGTAISDGTTYVTDDFSGAALWLAPGKGPDEEALTTLIENTLPSDKQATLASVIEEMGRFHPHEPHWYLPFVGVDPARQGQGLGTALLRPVLARCDASRLPAYLESSNPRNLPLYERLGFQALGEIRMSSGVVTPMLRRPAARA